jgi:hypothetical protein
LHQGINIGEYVMNLNAVQKMKDGGYFMQTSCDGARVFVGEDAKVLDLVFKYWKRKVMK